MNDVTHTVAAFVTARTGLVLSANQLDDLSRFLVRRFGAPGTVAAADCVARLHDPAEFRPLVDLLTVKETYFYRHETQFEALRDPLFARIAATAAAEERPIRLWSAGCCTGEEPYTLAIMAAECGLLDAVEILGSDINEAYLEFAMAGVYAPRAVRQLPEAMLSKYFVAQRDQFVITQEIRSRVTFKYLNLSEPTYPSFLNGTNGLDVIFCRNVLIYFDKPTVPGIVARFADCIRPDGVIAFGHSELLNQDSRLVAQQVGDAFFYTRREAALSVALSPATPRPPSRGRPVSKPLSPTKQITTTPPPTPVLGESPSDLVAQAARAADRGRTADAIALCSSALRRDPELVTAHYLLGLMSVETPEVAARHFRRVIYLDPNHLTARLHVAQCAERCNAVAVAIREYRALERLAAAHPIDEVLDSREGITFGMLALIARTGRQRLSDADPNAPSA